MTYPEINDKFFKYKKEAKENCDVQEFSSGRKVVYQKNTKAENLISCSVVYTKAEQETFWDWFNSIGQLSGVFTCPALGAGFYRFAEMPSVQDTRQKENIFDFEIEEL